MNIGIVCATYNEISSIIENMQDTVSVRIQGYTFYKAAKGDSRLIYAASGVGLEKAAECCNLLIRAFGVKHIINYGTCGALNPIFNSGDIVIPDKVFLLDKKTKNVSDMNYHYNHASDFNLVSHKIPVINIRNGSLVCAHDFVTKDEKAELFKNNLDIVDMESAGVVNAANCSGISVSLLKLLVDTWNYSFDSFDEYLKHEKEILRKYQDTVRMILSIFLCAFYKKNERCCVLD